MSIKKIQQALYNADLILEQEGDIPIYKPLSIDSHGFHFPPWVMPPNPDMNPEDHPMWNAYQEFLNTILADATAEGSWWGYMIGGDLGQGIGHLTGEQIGEALSTLNFGNFLSLMRFMLRPHIPNTIFTRFPWLRHILTILGIGPYYFQNWIRDILRQFMMETLDWNYEKLVSQYPHLYQPLMSSSEWDSSYHGAGDGGLGWRPENMKDEDEDDEGELPDDTGLGHDPDYSSLSNAQLRQMYPEFQMGRAGKRDPQY